MYTVGALRFLITYPYLSSLHSYG